MGNVTVSTEWYQDGLSECPDCGTKLERLRVVKPPTMLDVAERCLTCGWRVDFVPEGDSVQVYRHETL